MDVSLSQYRAFVALAEELHFGRAAARLRMTQPPLSRQIQAMERTLGVQLFVRRGRRTILTAAGETYLAEVRDVLQRMERAARVARLASVGAVGALDIGFTSVVGNAVLPSLLNVTRLGLPQVRVSLHEMFSVDQPRALLSGVLDLGLARPMSSDERLISRPLEDDPLMVAAPVGSEIARASHARLDQLDDQDFIMFAPDGPPYFPGLVSAVLSVHGVEPRIVQRVVGVYTMLSLVGSGLGYAIVPASSERWAGEGVQFVAVPELAEHAAKAVLMWHRDNMNPSLVRLFRLWPKPESKPLRIAPPIEEGLDGG